MSQFLRSNLQSYLQLNVWDLDPEKSLIKLEINVLIEASGMDLIHSMIFLPFVLSELENKPLPLTNTVSPAWLAAPSPTFQLRLQGLSLASLHTQVPSLVPARNSNNQMMILFFSPKCQETQQHVCVLGIMCCLQCLFLSVPAKGMTSLNGVIFQTTQH